MRAYKMSNGNLLIPVLVKGGMLDGGADVVSIGLEVVPSTDPRYATWEKFATGQVIEAPATPTPGAPSTPPSGSPPQPNIAPGAAAAGANIATQKAMNWVFPDEHAFPVLKPADITAALREWGSYKGKKSRDEFNRALALLAKRLGPPYMALIPQNIRQDHPDVVKPVAKADESISVENRQFQPNVGGGVDRDKLKGGDFVFGDERKFPVVKPIDVQHAVSSWGRYKGSHSFDDFRKNLIALAKRKGASFVKALPASWNVAAS